MLFSLSCGGDGGGMARLRELDLSECAVSDRALELISCALRRGAMPNLWALRLDSCAISSRGTAALAAALAHPKGAAPLPKLMYLQLMCNDVGDDGACALAFALNAGAAASLCELDLRGNPIASAGTERLNAACAHRDISLRV